MELGQKSIRQKAFGQEARQVGERELAKNGCLKAFGQKGTCPKVNK
jgi:hypothetical protein